MSEMNRPQPKTFADSLMNFLARRDEYQKAKEDKHISQNEINIRLRHMLMASEEINDTLAKALFQVIDNGR